VRLSRRSACRSPAFRAARSANICIKAHAGQTCNRVRFYYSHIPEPLHCSKSSCNWVSAFISPQRIRAPVPDNYILVVHHAHCPWFTQKRQVFFCNVSQQNRRQTSEIKRAASVPYSFPRVHRATPSASLPQSCSIFSIPCSCPS
jgi:hypothetical protein